MAPLGVVSHKFNFFNSYNFDYFARLILLLLSLILLLDGHTGRVISIFDTKHEVKGPD